VKTFFKQKALRLKGKKKTEFRKQVFAHFEGICQDPACGCFNPLFDQDGVFDVFTCGHVSHIKSLGAGGSDTIENVLWKCYECHINKEHGLKFNK
jgi:hypothetical protein